MNRAVFLDRDGTVIVEKNYLRDPAQVELLPGVASALRRLRLAGFKLILVTNQSGIGRGYFTVQDMHRVHARLARDLARHDVRFENIFFAPEAPDQPSRGRKPSPQFLFDARDAFTLDLAGSYLIGDKFIDLECGWNAGVRKCLLVRTGYGAEVERSHARRLRRAVVVDDLPAAADWILDDRSKPRATRSSFPSPRRRRISAPMAEGFWLVKQEPEDYSWDRFAADGGTAWTGVRSFPARNHLRGMKRGDRVLYYHSGTGKEIVGIARVARTAYADPTAEEGDWSSVDLAPVKDVKRPVSLAAVKADPALRTLALVRQSRLSVMPVSAAQFARILELGETSA